MSVFQGGMTMAVMGVTAVMGTTAMGVMAIMTTLMDLATMVSIRLVTVLCMTIL